MLLRKRMTCPCKAALSCKKGFEDEFGSDNNSDLTSLVHPFQRGLFKRAVEAICLFMTSSPREEFV